VISISSLFHHEKPPELPCFGYLAEFPDGDALLEAAKASRAAGYREMEAYTPIPMHDLSHVLGYKSRLPALVFCGGLFGALAGWGMQYWASVHAYPVNIAGKPLNSWPSFVIITFEMTILCAALTAVLGMLALNGLPRPHHPVFSVPQFGLASRDRFFLLLMARDPLFDVEATEKFMHGLDAVSVEEVPNP
jgi:hypothetical protein